ncbi:hypothetical protein KDA11_02740, partial [Candidatus Saccharibacteria bacterium]|nr:hypothetical protein [Candidatus Saccharibacteria bacterium]
GNFTWEILDSAQNRLNNWRTAIDILWQPQHINNSIDIMSYINKILIALQNDLDTSTAVNIIDKAIDQIQQGNIQTNAIRNFTKAIEKLIGIDLMLGKHDITQEQKTKLERRQQARDQQDWQTSDNIRNNMLEEGILIRDTSTGQMWTRLT